MKELYKSFILLFIVFCSTAIFGQAIVFQDNFDTYVAGQQLACQNPVDWTTWSNSPCGPDDGFVSSNQSYSGSNSLVIVPVNDQVKPLGNLTTGKYQIDFMMFIPTGKDGYFNTLNTFPATVITDWAMEAYFDIGGGGRMTNVPGAPITFSYPVNSWFPVRVVVDLDNDLGEFYVNSVLVNSWQWTQGGTMALRLAANDFYGPLQTTADEAYYDDYTVWDMIVPVELTSFTANVNNMGEVILNWSTATETNNHMFEIQRRSGQTEFATIGFVNGYGTTTEPKNYVYTDRTVGTGTYYYRLKQIDFDGSYEYFDEIEIEVKGPLTFALEQNYPNPFNPSTKINYSIPQSGFVKLSVYNIVGEEVAVLVNGQVEAGFYEVTFDAANLPSGAYFYKLQSGNTVEVKKMLLTK